MQEDYEIWKPKLPQDYEEIIKKSKSSSFTERKKDLYNMFTKGILLHDDKLWFSLGSNGKRNAMISARKFLYRNRSPHKWQSDVSESRFQKVAEMLDISNLMIKIKTTTKYLSPGVGYGVYLVFKFCNLKEFSSKPMYVNLKYRKGSETFHAYFATWRDKDWMMIELERFVNQTEEVVFKFLLVCLSPYYYADDAIYVEGIEFRAINNVEHKEISKLKEVQHVLKSTLKKVQKFPTKSEEIFKKSNDGEKLLLPPSEMNGKKHLMLSARTTLYNFSNLKLYKSTPTAESRFQEVVELLPQQVFRINCTFKAQILPPDTLYETCKLAIIDAVGSTRKQWEGHTKKKLHQPLVEMDGFEQNEVEKLQNTMSNLEEEKAERKKEMGTLGQSNERTNGRELSKI